MEACVNILLDNFNDPKLACKKFVTVCKFKADTLQFKIKMVFQFQLTFAHNLKLTEGNIEQSFCCIISL